MPSRKLPSPFAGLAQTFTHVASSREYTGTLAEPIAPRVTTIWHVLDDQCAVDEMRRRYVEDEFKLDALADHFGIGRKNYRALSLALARQHVPGFKWSEPRGYNSKWNLMTRGVLIVEMERTIVLGERLKGISWAAKQLARQSHWKKFVRVHKAGKQNTSDTAEVLRTEYTRHKAMTGADAFRKSFLLHEEAGTIPEWDDNVRAILERPNERFAPLPDFDPGI